MNTETIARELADLIVPADPRRGLRPGPAAALAHQRCGPARGGARGRAAYVELVRGKEGTSHGAIEAAVDVGAAYVEARVPIRSPRPGSEPRRRARCRARRLGTLLAADPTVGVRGG